MTSLFNKLASLRYRETAKTRRFGEKRAALKTILWVIELARAKDGASNAEIFKILVSSGAVVKLGAQTNIIRLATVSASCAGSNDAGLVIAWEAAANRAIERLSA
jgi:hypothetical protein